MMNHIKNPLKKSLLRVCAVSFSVLCVALTLLNYFSYRSMLFRQYRDHMRNVLTNTAAEIDVDDLAWCIRTGIKSAAYQRLQTELDMRKDNTDLHFLYIIIPLNTEERDNIQNVIAAMSREEYQEDPDALVELNSLTGDAYSPAVAQKYLDAYNGGTLSFFTNVTEFGDDFTALYPLYDSKGNKIAALCVDVEMSEINQLLLSHSLQTVGVTLLAGLLISVLFLLWTKKNVVRPIETLESCLSDYTADGLDSENPDSLRMDLPDIHTGNEVESLARKIVYMSETLRDTVITMLHTEQELAHMSIIATKDELTHVGNKAAYKDYVGHLQQLVDERNAAFAVVMADINWLKVINDTYGHEKGDIYIRNCCNVLCDVYLHSPVYRIGGDEFVIFLTDRDYEIRKELFISAKKKLARAQRNKNADPWNAPSIALGMVDYLPESDRSVQQVVNRADRKMYADKARIHRNSNMPSEKRG